MMRRAIFIVIFIFSVNAFAEDSVIAKYSDENTSLFGPGKNIDIRFKDQKCILSSQGSSEPARFLIILGCNNTNQVLWDSDNIGADDPALDDPKFELLWAGDADNDDKLDLKMELSQKYSCSRKVVFLSSLAKQGKLVGLKGNPPYKCGN